MSNFEIEENYHSQPSADSPEAAGLQQQAHTVTSNSGSKQVSGKSDTIELDDEHSVLRRKDIGPRCYTGNILIELYCEANTMRRISVNYLAEQLKPIQLINC